MSAAEDHLVLDLKTSYPEYVIKVGKIIFGEKKDKISEKDQREIREKIRKEMPEKSSKEINKIISQIKQERKRKIECQTTHLRRAACALLNSGGGIIRAEIEDEGFSLEQSVIGQELIKALKKCIHYSEYPEYFDFKQEESAMLIFVKSWSSGNSTYPRLCSLNTGLYERDSSSAMIRDPINALSFLRRKKAAVIEHSCIYGELSSKKACLNIPPSSEVGMQEEEALPEAATQFLKRDQLTYGEILNQLAESPEIDFKAFPKDKEILAFVKSKLPVYVSAFASAKGGLVIFGVDDSKMVCGHTQNVEPYHMEEEAQKIINKRPHFHFCTSRQNVTHEFKIFPVRDTNEKSHGFVFAVRIKPFCCAVFSNPPDSWAVKRNAVKRIEASEWCKQMTEEDQDMSEFKENFERELSILNKPLLCKPVYSIKGVNSLKHLQQSLFPVNSDGITYKPETLCTDIFCEYPGLKNFMEKKMEELQVSKGILIFSRSWAVDIGLKEKEKVACDILLIAPNTFPTLYNFGESGTFELLSEYSTNVAQILKQKLVNEGGYSGKVCVIPHVIELAANGELGRDSGLVTYPPDYKVSENNLQELLRSLVIVLLKFKSALSDQLGYEFFNLLTLKQYEILQRDLHKKPKLFIYGLPGSGKTILAKEIIKRIKNVFRCCSEEVLFICENRPLCNTVREEGICQAVTRASFLVRLYPKCSFPHSSGDDPQPIVNCVCPTVKHIIIDEAQNFQSRKKTDWYAKAQKITKGNGVLWVFLDYLQTTHTFGCGLPDLCDQVPQEWLTTGVRNATRIYEDMWKLIQKIISEPTGLNIPYEQLEKLLEDAKCGHRLEGVLKKPWQTKQHEIVTYIVSEIVTYLRKGYSMENIAVLCNATKERDVYKSLLEDEMSRRETSLGVAFTTLDEANGNGIVVDSIRRFSGLERFIMFGIFSRSVKLNIANNLLLCMVSRANLHFHLLRET